MKRIITIQDISCVGRCSLTVALPIVSAAGVEACILPTAVLSTHTAFPKFTFLDLTDEIENISRVFTELDIGFDAIYTGYLGSKRQISLVCDFFDAHKKDGTFVVVDPAMADNGKLYYGFDEDFVREMASLAARADLVIPNITEATLMLGLPYAVDYDEDYVRRVLVGLTDLGAKSAAISGVDFGDGRMGVYYYNSVTKSYFSYFNEKLPTSYHGTGDVYASATVGAIMRGASPEDALALAVDFTLEAIRMTAKDPERRFYGVNFEEALPFYIERLRGVKN